MDVFRLHREGLNPASGEGAAIYGGRWNHKNFSVVYCAESRSLGVLESVVHLVRLPINYCLTVFSIPKSVPIEIVDAVSLSKGWDGPITTSVTQDIGTEWLKSMRSAVLRIPAVVIEGEFNYLLNPRHSDFSSITILPSRPFRFDARLRPPTVLKEIL